METITVTETLKILRCPVCGMIYAVPDDWYAQTWRRHNEDGVRANWYCPQGHSVTFRGESELDQIRRERDRLKQNNARLNEIAAEAQEKLRRQARRSAAGVCPCCHRTFQQLARHMMAKHPQIVKFPLAAPNSPKIKLSNKIPSP